MIPFDATNHIQGIAQGIQSAMPGIEAAMPGDENIQKYIDEFTRRRMAGESKDAIMADLLPQVKALIHAPAPQMPSGAGTSDLGMVNGQPAMGGQGSVQPVASGPNTITPQPQMPQQPGAPIQQTPQAPPSPIQQAAAPIQQAPAPPTTQPQMYGPGVQPQGGIAQAAMAPQSPPEPQSQYTRTPPIPMQYGPGVTPPPPSPVDTTESRPDMSAEGRGNVMMQDHVSQGPKLDGIDLTRKQPMQTQTTEAPPPKVMNRGQQDRAMAGIQQVQGMEAKDAASKFKYSKQETDSTLRLLKILVDSKKNDHAFAKDFEQFRNTLEGVETGKQKFLIDKWIQLHMNEADNAARIQGARINASRPRGSGTAKLSPAMQLIKEQYNKVRGLRQSMNNAMSGTAPETERYLKEEAQIKAQWDAQAKKEGLPLTPVDDALKEEE